MRNTLIKMLILVALSAISVPAISQDVFPVSAIQDGNKIIVNYNIDYPAKSVKLAVSRDGGKTFSAPLKEVSGDIKNVSKGSHSITWKVLEEYDSLVGDDIVFKIIVDPKPQKSSTASSSHEFHWDFLIEANYAPWPLKSWGVTVGMVHDFGFYGKYLRNLGYADVTPKYKCDSNGLIHDSDPGLSSDNSNSLLTSGNSLIRRYAYCGGMILNFDYDIYLNLGAGYGVRDMYYKDSAGDYALVEDSSYHGLTLDAGVTCRLGCFALSAGAMTTAFKTIDVVVGLGFMF